MSDPYDPPEWPSALQDVLAYLRRLASSCEPPVGVGAFDVLYANAHEVVVWYSPVRPEQRCGEVVIQTAWLAAAWSALADGGQLDEPALNEIGAGRWGGRWLLALLAQLPGVRVHDDPLSLVWTGQRTDQPGGVSSAGTAASKPKRTKRAKATACRHN